VKPGRSPANNITLLGRAWEIVIDVLVSIVEIVGISCNQLLLISVNIVRVYIVVLGVSDYPGPRVF
jgi:hypothetical protein